MALVSPTKDKDWVSVRQANARLSSLKLGPTSFPTFAGMTLTEGLTLPFLTDDSLIYPSSGGVLTSLGVAADGQLVIGSTGTTPVLSTLTGTANQITSTPGAGSITLSTPQDIHTAASNFTVAGETITDLTASRLMYSNGTKVLSSVSDLTSWIAGTTDHISVSDDSDGTVTLDLDTNTQTLLGSFNGIFLEKLNFTISESGGTVTGSLEQDNGGDLTQKFSDGYNVLDTTPALTVDLTAYVGTDAVPKEVFVYILRSAKTVIAASNVDWPLNPEVEHIKIAHLVLKSAVTTGLDDGALMNQNHNDYAFDETGEGHIQDIEHRLRQEPAVHDSGTALTLKNAGGTELTTGNSSTAVELVIATGQIFQIHRHTFPAVDMFTTATDDAHIVNQPVDEGGGFLTSNDLVTDVAHYVDGTNAGVAIGVNKYFNLVVWGVMNRSGEPSHVMVNLPTGQYNISANAVSDMDGTSIYQIPSAFKGTGFLIARLTFRKIGGGQWTYIAQEDLRGKLQDIIAGVGITTTDHALLANLGFALAGHTGFLAEDGSVALTGAWDMGSQILTNVNIDTGDINTAVVNTEWDAAFAHVSNDGSDHSFIDQSVLIAASPTFVGMTLSGSLSLGFGDLVSEQNPDAVNAIRLKGTASDVDVVLGVSGYFNIWNATDATQNDNVFSVNSLGNTDIAGNLTVDGSITGHVIGTDVQAWDASLDSIAALTYASDSFIKVTAEDTYAIRTIAQTKTDLSLNNVSNVATSDTAYNSTSWNNNFDAPTKNTIRDKIGTMDNAINSNTAHSGSGGSDHSIVVSNTTAITDHIQAIIKGGSGEITAQLSINALSAVSAATNEHVLTKDTGTGNAIWKAAADGGDNDKVGVDSGAIAGYLGAADNDGVLRTGGGLSYTDGGNFVTLAVSGTYVDRGDPAAYDYTQATLTTDGTWRDLDLSGIVPAGAKAVSINLLLADDVAGSFFALRKNGNTNAFLQTPFYIQVVGRLSGHTVTVACDTNRVIEYFASNLTWSTITIVVNGWWI